MIPTPEQRLYLAAINVGRLEIALENAKMELSEATRLFAETIDPVTLKPIIDRVCAVGRDMEDSNG